MVPPPQTRKYSGGWSSCPFLVECLEIPNAETYLLTRTFAHAHSHGAQDYTWVTLPPVFQLTLKFLPYRKPSLCPLARLIPLIYTHYTCSPLVRLLVQLLPPPVDCDLLESRELPYSYLCLLLGL